MKPITIQFRQIPNRLLFSPSAPNDPLYLWEASGEAHTGFGETMEEALANWSATYPGRRKEIRTPTGIFDI